MFELGTTTILKTNAARPPWTGAAKTAADALSVSNAGKSSADKEDLCHSISSGLMQTWIKEIINDGSASVQAKINGLKALVAAVNTPNGYQTSFNNGFNALALDLSQSNNPTNRNNIVFYANELYKALYNTCANLRRGSSQWNRGIQECYDPVSWIHVDGSGRIDSSSDANDTRNTGFQIPAWAKDCFFLTDTNDCDRLVKLFPVEPVKTGLNIIANKQQTANGTLYFIHSSNNVFGVSAGTVTPSGQEIYFYNRQNRTWLSV